MIVFYLFFGVVTGFIGFSVALLLGESFWSALLAYCLVGAVSVAGASVVMARLAARRGIAVEEEPLSGEEPAPAAEIPSVPVVESAEAADGPMRILAVDDDPFILELLPKIAATAGFPAVTTASSAAVALGLVQSAAQPFDCLLIDINMPEINGIELCARIRALPDYHDTPVIMLTAMTDLDHMNRAFRAGASDFATKPFDINDFSDRLKIADARLAVQRAGSDHKVKIDASERLSPLEGVPALINPRALASYVSRLSGSALTGAYAMVVSIDPATTDGPVRSLATLARTARAIESVFGLTRYVMAHVGQGQFILVANGAVTPEPEAVRSDLLYHLNKVLDELNEPRIGLLVGPAVRLQTAKADRARIAFESAMTLAEREAGGKGASPALPGAGA